MNRFRLAVLLITLLLSACSISGTQPTPEMTSEVETVVPSPSPTPTPLPPASFTICTAAQPKSLFPFDGVEQVIKSNLLAMLEDAPLTLQDGVWNPGIVQQVPSSENDALQLQAVSVQPGQTVVDARGELVVIKAGVQVRPSGCRASACAITWDGQSPLEMDQMSLNFKLVEGLSWSDGTPVTAQDSVWSYTLASDNAAPGLHWADSRTERYTAVSDYEVVWVGKPGFTTAALSDFFWTPLPAHLVSAEMDWQSIAADAILTERPVSFGPFTMAARDAEFLRLKRNPHYFRAEEGLPLLDEIIVEVIADPASAVQALEEGRCDLLDESYGLQNNPDLVMAFQGNADYAVLITEGEVLEQLVLGIQPASYDDYYNPVYGDRPDVLGDVRTRKAMAACLSKEAMLAGDFAFSTAIWSSFLPPSQSQVLGESAYAYDPVLGAELLMQVGWRDHDLNPETPLQAWEVANVPPGTLFEVTLMVDDSASHQQIAAAIQNDLAACGIGVTVLPQPAVELFAPGPSGVIFGRQFDLTLLAWQPLPDPGCGVYLSWQIPNSANSWIGTNIAGYADAAYDAVCADARLALPAQSGAVLLEAENAFIESLPAIPLFGHTSVMLTRTNPCDPETAERGGLFFEMVETLMDDINCP